MIKIIDDVLPLLLFVGFVTSSYVPLTKMEFTHGGGQLIPWEPRTTISSDKFPCPKVGFYPHPSNCSRFYRCSDYGNQFTRHLFECRAGEVYAATIESCIPGACPEIFITEPASGEGPENTGTSGNVGDSGSAGEQGIGGGSESAGEQGSDGDSENTGDSESNTDFIPPSNLPPLIDEKIKVFEIEGELTSSQECEGIYTQSKNFCNLFHHCKENWNRFYLCFPEMAFEDERQLCELTQFNPELCVGKNMFVPSKRAFLDAFSWKNVGYTVLFDHVPNASPIVFVNLDKEDEDDTSIPKPLPLTDDDKTWEIANLPREAFESGIRSVFDSYKSESVNEETKDSQEKHSQKEPSFKKPSKLKGYSESLLNSLADYEVIGIIQNPYLSPNPYNFISNSGGYTIQNAQQQAQSQLSTPFIVPVYRNPSTSPFVTQAVKSYSPLLRQDSSTSSGFSSYPYSPPIAFYPSSSSSSSSSSGTYSPYISSQFSYPNAFYSLASSPFSSSSGTYFPYPSPTVTTLPSASFSTVASPFGYRSSPSRYTLIPVTIPLTSIQGLRSSSSLNPYTRFQSINKGESDSLKSSVFPLNPFIQKYPFLYGSSVTKPEASLSADIPAVEARNEEKDYYHFIPVSKEEVTALAESGLLDETAMSRSPLTYDDITDMDIGDVILTSFTGYEK